MMPSRFIQAVLTESTSSFSIGGPTVVVPTTLLPHHCGGVLVFIFNKAEAEESSLIKI